MQLDVKGNGDDSVLNFFILTLAQRGKNINVFI